MSTHNKPILISVLPLLSVKRGRIKSIVTKMLDQEKPSSVSLDLTDVGTSTYEETVMTLIAEALQEFGICDPGLTAGADCKYHGNAVNEFRRILNVLERRTVRMVFGEELNDMLDQTDTVRDAKKLLDEPSAGSVCFRRFDTEAEAKAYILALDDADGWFDHNTIQNFSGNVIKASRKIPVEAV